MVVSATAWKSEEKCLRALSVWNATTHTDKSTELKKNETNKSRAGQLICIYVDAHTASRLLSVNLREVITLGMNNDSCDTMGTLMA